MVARLRDRCPCRIAFPFILLLLSGILISNPTLADEFWPSNINPPQSFPTLEAAETAMRAVSADAALLQFDHLSVSGIHTYRYYAVPPVPASPPFWSDCGNVPGYYDSGQAVCDARTPWINWPRPLIYTPDPDKPQDGFGRLGSCRDPGNVLGYPGRWVKCPSGYNLANVTELGSPCGGNSGTWVGWGPNVNCKNYTTAFITVQSTQSVHCGISLSGFPAEVEPGKAVGNLQARVTCTGKSPEGIAVTIAPDVSAFTGGHLHDAGRRPVHAGAVGFTGSNGNVTDANGDVPFTFSAPAPAGDHTVTAKCADDSCGEATGSVWVGIKGLKLQAGSPNYFLLPNRDANHPGNHYVTSATEGKVADFAAAYHKKFPNDPVLHFNDASLIRGGLFDINSNWQFPHETHQFGRNVDVKANEFYHEPSQSIPSWNYIDFWNMGARYGCFVALHSSASPNEHFHLHCP